MDIVQPRTNGKFTTTPYDYIVITIVVTIFGGLTADLPEMAMERERESNSDHIQEIPRAKSLELC